MMHPSFGNNPEFWTFRVPLTVTSWMQPWSHPTPQSGLPLAVCLLLSVFHPRWRRGTENTERRSTSHYFFCAEPLIPPRFFFFMCFLSCVFYQVFAELFASVTTSVALAAHRWFAQHSNGLGVHGINCTMPPSRILPHAH